MAVTEDKRVTLADGRDEFGRYFEFTVGSATLRMRWLEPGEFMMGSPTTELGRVEHETYHHVTISRGFWLGETACTQRLWQEVTKRTPARFKGDNRPVEQVSWNDTIDFVTTANQLHPDLRLRLPTEAEWEYGCRAGTSTPFWFGETITTDQVNYNGMHPYGDGPAGPFRNQTVEVRTLPPNEWGLYEMHGNTWEWCHDYYIPDLGTDPVIDPQGPSTGEFRIMRGACWYDHAGTTRSAFRNTGRQTLRIPFLGVRFARDAEQ